MDLHNTQTEYNDSRIQTLIWKQHKSDKLAKSHETRFS